ncbi:flavin monoamine oxidase family protein [Hymenobacter pini]|uniref:flavin monoamine oxidase family protein n=1 Tax=Hymenobacter pini TaxID=2880879 RepID=UPI001CF1FAE5|nr:NAD(P)/FAD-dependent oxidoreductase [Hymenobacter pini]MCA8829495.1 FAD-dependent oxidoreductase [Hymenobacter pini]
MMTIDVLIIGAGGAGLLAARNLAQAGRHVTILEARSRPGGRICTLGLEAGFSAPTEAGAEFLHGNVPLTRELLTAYGIRWYDTAGTTYEVAAGQAQQAEVFLKDMPLLLERLHQLPHDMPLAEFLTEYFPGPEYAELRRQATAFAEGYDAADARRVSSLALRDEWSGNGAEDSPRPEGGYAGLVQGLTRELEAAGAQLVLGAQVARIEWQPGQVIVRCQDGRVFQAPQLLLTVPLGVWQAPAGQPGHLPIHPDLPEHHAAAQALGFGPVIKYLLEFDAPIWEQLSADVVQPLPEVGFLFSDAAVPTWWSQQPRSQPLLTGWLAGPAAAHRQHYSPAELLTEALGSLAYLLQTTPAHLRQHLKAHQVLNWGTDPLALGAYSYPTLNAAQFRATLSTPVAGTLFIAGEAVYTGPYSGTVEAALVTGAAAAQQILRISAQPA